MRICWRIALAGIVLGVFIAAGPAAGAQQRLPTVRIEATTAARLYWNFCVSPAKVDVRPGRVVVSRTVPITAKLPIAYQVTGPAEHGPGAAEFAAGSRTTAISVIPRVVAASGHVEVRVLPGADYDLGSPVVGTVDVSVIESSCGVPTTTVAPLVSHRDLPRTGSNDATVALVGAALVSAGGALLSMRRGRRAHKRG